MIYRILLILALSALAAASRAAESVAAPAAADPLIPKIQALRSAYPNARISVEYENIVGAHDTNNQTASGNGASAHLRGAELKENFNASAPNAGLSGVGDASGGKTASGSEVFGAAPLSIAQAQSNKLFWVALGIIFFGAGGIGAGLWLQNPLLSKGGIYVLAGGVCLFAISFFPWLLIPLSIIAFAAFAYPFIKNTQIAHKASEALRAVVAGVDHPSVDPAASAAVKAAIKTETTEQDKATIKAVKAADDVKTLPDPPAPMGPQILESGHVVFGKGLFVPVAAPVGAVAPAGPSILQSVK